MSPEMIFAMVKISVKYILSVPIILTTLLFITTGCGSSIILTHIDILHTQSDAASLMSITLNV